MSRDKFIFDPKNPESYFAAFTELQNFSLDLQKEMLNNNKTSESNNQAFFEEINKKQEYIINSQIELHSEAKITEDKLTTSPNITPTHKEFDKSINFFKEKENKMGVMSEKMEDLSKTVSQLPD